MSTSLFIIAAAALLLSWGADRQRTVAAVRLAGRSLLGLVPAILGMVSLVGLVLALIPPHVLQKLFAAHGIGGFVLVSLVGSLVSMPGPVAFPLAGSLLRLGANPAALAAFITTLTMVGTVTAPLEVSYFGRRFTLLRQLLSFASAILIGLLMGVFL